ncbi:MAG: hypothetical protein ACH0QD_03585 [Tepidibacillus sp.]
MGDKLDLILNEIQSVKKEVQSVKSDLQTLKSKVEVLDSNQLTFLKELREQRLENQTRERIFLNDRRISVSIFSF